MTGLAKYGSSTKLSTDYDKSGRVWNDKLNRSFLRLGFTCLIADQCIYIRIQDQDLVIAAVHVDDMALFASNNDEVTNLKGELRKEFTITDLGELKQIVGLEVT